MTTEHSRQCTLIRIENNNKEIIVSYIPECFAHIGKTLKLKNDSGKWTDGWIVSSVSEIRNLSSEVHRRSRNYLDWTSK